MAQAALLPVMALLSVLGTGTGVYLGKSAVAEIDPIYFSSPIEARFHSDLAANGSPDWSAVHLQETAAMAADTHGLGSGCIKCREYPEEYVPRHDAAVDAFISGDPAPVARFAALEEGSAQPAAPDPERERIERYSSFVVTEEGAPQAAEPVLAAEPVAEQEETL